MQNANHVHKGLIIWMQVTKVKKRTTTTTAGKMLQKGVIDKLQKDKQVQAKVNVLIQSCWLPVLITQYPKQKTARRQSLQISSWTEL